ncbi:hypothetical protein VFPFJ_10876 [Purpureocillium lilacinum]|uniref:Uncharacterized protein n=1 Tax=Purpureocillium lilacinum TaxID=33203 RepID=A0A179GF35_PURLI|nr:hypothetical protein VFPFJ_10876 [Purpureocillium lilacinum]OAQ75038.1 hypothetical protein VFPFJ_10876 [Purpureocillium lilacinum]OAQ75739.1 hypothetical protein VFPBJ_09712 [Purpureocillium lilacinum]
MSQSGHPYRTRRTTRSVLKRNADAASNREGHGVVSWLAVSRQSEDTIGVTDYQFGISAG